MSTLEGKLHLFEDDSKPTTPYDKRCTVAQRPVEELVQRLQGLLFKDPWSGGLWAGFGPEGNNIWNSSYLGEGGGGFWGVRKTTAHNRLSGV